jgi:hypothetical protein
MAADPSALAGHRLGNLRAGVARSISRGVPIAHRDLGALR